MFLILNSSHISLYCVLLLVGGSRSVVLELRVKFYTSDPVFLVEELTRYLFFRQIKKDLLENR